MRVNVIGFGIISNFKVETKQYNKIIINSLFQKNWESGHVVTGEKVLSAKTACVEIK